MVIAKFNQQTGILDSNFTGDVTLKEVVDYIIATKENKSYPRKLKILTDATNSNMNFNASDLYAIVDENNKSLEQYQYIIDAIVIESPKETALSILYQEIAKNPKYKFRIFSTRDAAAEWLSTVFL